MRIDIRRNRGASKIEREPVTSAEERTPAVYGADSFKGRLGGGNLGRHYFAEAHLELVADRPNSGSLFLRVLKVLARGRKIDRANRHTRHEVVSVGDVEVGAAQPELTRRVGHIAHNDD